MGLEEEYEVAQQNEAAITAKIISAFKTFAARTPEFKNTEANRAKLFEIMEQARVEDGRNPTRPSDWSDAYARFLFIYDKQRPVVSRKKATAAPVSKLTREEVDSWPAVRLQREIESSPARGKEIEAALSRR